MPHSNKLLDGNLFNTFYTLQVSANQRFSSSFTLVFIHPPSDASDWETYLQNSIRDTDIAFRFSAPHPYVVLLAHSNEKEAEVFVSRIISGWRAAGHEPEGIAASIVKVSSATAPVEHVLKTGRDRLLQMTQSSDETAFVVDHTYAIREPKVIKVSILEEDPVVTQVLSNLLERSVIPQVTVELRVFHDGFEFLESDWYHSAHTHVVILNDVLPKKNGIEVLYELRAMPNERKFHVFMMTQRQTEEEMVYAYEHGVDEYIIKPFNPKLFEAQVKKVLGRLYT